MLYSIIIYTMCTNATLPSLLRWVRMEKKLGVVMENPVCVFLTYRKGFKVRTIMGSKWETGQLKCIFLRVKENPAAMIPFSKTLNRMPNMHPQQGRRNVAFQVTSPGRVHPLTTISSSVCNRAIHSF